MGLQPRDIRLETDRLILTLYRPSDFPDLHELSADPETFRYSERGPMTSDEAWSRLLRHVGHWSLMGYGMFAVREKASGDFVGETGFCDFRRELGPAFDTSPEGSWTIARWAQRRGYATEAAGAALRWLEDELGVTRTVCLIGTRNAASLRIGEKLGYRSFDECVYKGYPALLLERERPTVA